MQYRFFICDVFTTERFGGNQLAVFPDATGLDTGQMQQLAREFNYSESTFVLPADGSFTRRVRIFTPTVEVPFAGHPNIGTAFTLAADGVFGDIEDEISVLFDEAAGPVPVLIRREGEMQFWCELEAPQALSLGDTADPALVAAVLSLDESDIGTSVHVPQVASVGLPFLFVELASRDALERARVDMAQLEKLRDSGVVPDVHVYTQSNDEFDIRARMFAPFGNVIEDPATGSANCALVALLTQSGVGNAAGDSWRIAQGVEMGRPSVLQARTRREDGVIQTWVGGHSVLVADGKVYVN